MTDDMKSEGQLEVLGNRGCHVAGIRGLLAWLSSQGSRFVKNAELSSDVVATWPCPELFSLGTMLATHRDEFWAVTGHATLLQALTQCRSLA